jgi:hypothetical protein
LAAQAPAQPPARGAHQEGVEAGEKVAEEIHTGQYSRMACAKRNILAAITNTIIAGNLAPLNKDISGTFALRYDLVQVTGTATITVSTGNVFGLDPQLSPLADNGGPTRPAPTSVSPSNSRV